MTKVKQLQDILKKYDGKMEIYLGPNKLEKLNAIDFKELLSDVTKWSNLSAQGLVCGILGCSVNPKNQCLICHCTYCLEHIRWHVHSISNTGILEKDSSEMR